ncbi:MAG TPA: nucleotidyltransferase family protein [Parafilimonas sp.]|nr:nucleotidyltransferase family protein [Parafilimonas sp.]
MAAGASERLGEPKQLLMHKGSSLLKHAVTEAVRSNAEQVIVVLGANADIIVNELDENEAHIVINTGWEEGMASSVRTGINALLEISAAVDAAILMPCDQPYVSASLLNELISKQEETGKRIIACDYGEALGPPSLFQKDLFSELLMLEGDAGARKIIEKHGDDVATVLFRKGSVDIDTKDDYEALNSLLS